MRRTLATLTMLATTTLVPLAGIMATAAPAHADIVSCANRLNQLGLDTQSALHACLAASQGEVEDCVDIVGNFGILRPVALPICRLATRA